jgi:hypothetical protein
MVPDRLWYCTDHRVHRVATVGRHTNPVSSLGKNMYSVVQTMLLAAVYSHVPAKPAARPIFSYKWGAAGWGE